MRIRTLFLHKHSIYNSLRKVTAVRLWNYGCLYVPRQVMHNRRRMATLRPAFRIDPLLIRRVRSAAGAFVLILLATLGFQSSAKAQANVEGQWNTLSTQMPINPVHVALLHTGNVLIVSGSGNFPSDTSYMAAVWDPATDTVTTQPLQWDMFCNGMIVLPDGRPFVMGGTLQYDPFLGQPLTSAYDPATGSFVDLQSMANGRWYPTATTL